MTRTRDGIELVDGMAIYKKHPETGVICSGITRARWSPLRMYSVDDDDDNYEFGPADCYSTPEAARAEE
jgi:hypothetical protein